ncbi:hypothetical protein NUU61_006962 [Penicillium alfredii]|uniref:NAD dependent epimerase/dehydratase n=1 Tax=Penicillium alfredii TaxID=1506179 RepID=A0A9W9F221_9EURO|nr:uncharacterized protein NUU61_006962 [Penicillium alfredii]KAJ5092092.1 hypothetical protein NUU61_006962 [Penicillium alfredii]
MGQQASVPAPNTSIQVIGAGLPRTGSASFSRALETLLEGPVYHCGTQTTMGTPDEIKTWMQILQHWLRGPSDRHTVLKLMHRKLAGYAAITDSPGAQFVPELMELFPTAKVICTVRDPDSWDASMKQVRGKTEMWFVRAVLLPLPGMRHFISYGMLLRDQWTALYRETPPGRDSYTRHVAWLKEIVPADRLVFFDVRDGWEPLCAALGRDVPADCPFPRVNDSEAIDRTAKYHVRRGLTRWAVGLALVGVSVVALVRYW